MHDGVFIHETSIVEEPCIIGKGTKIWHFCHIVDGVVLGNNCNIGQNIFIDRGVQIGNGVKIQNNVSLNTGMVVEDYVFCGQSSTFTHIMTPRAHVTRKSKAVPILIKKGATIGANATVISGYRRRIIGSYAMVGAGSVVTEDVPDYALVYGVPAKQHGWVCQCGVKLDFQTGVIAECSECGKKYEMDQKGGIENLNG